MSNWKKIHAWHKIHVECGDDNVDENSCSTPLKKGHNYRGTVSVTKSGKMCQRWDSQFPHEHSDWTHEKHPSAGLVENYCRNSSNGDGTQPWCYTTDANTVWENCSVPEFSVD
eukprot:747603_1